MQPGASSHRDGLASGYARGVGGGRVPCALAGAASFVDDAYGGLVERPSRTPAAGRNNELVVIAGLDGVLGESPRSIYCRVRDLALVRSRIAPGQRTWIKPKGARAQLAPLLGTGRYHGDRGVPAQPVGLASVDDQFRLPRQSLSSRSHG